jgi:hypothetical protein
MYWPFQIFNCPGTENWLFKQLAVRENELKKKRVCVDCGSFNDAGGGSVGGCEVLKKFASMHA